MLQELLTEFSNESTAKKYYESKTSYIYKMIMRKFLKKKGTALFFIYIVLKNLNDFMLRYKDFMPRVFFIYFFVLQENLNYFRNVCILFARLRFISDIENFLSRMGNW